MEEEKKFKSILVSPEIKLEYIYNGDLNFEAIRESPILKPISEINKNYCDLHLTATKAVIEWEELYKKLQEMEVINPRYTNTVLMATIREMINKMQTIVHSQDLCDVSMKNCINEMLEINDRLYKYLNDEEERFEKAREEMREEMELKYKKRYEESKKEEIGTQEVEEVLVPKSNEEDKFAETLENLKRIVGEDKKEIISEKLAEKPEKIYSNLLQREM